MAGYKFLDYLKEQKVDFKFTPFSQKATTNNVDDWAGSCNIIVHDWMLAKVSQNNLLDPTSYRIDKANLPHPVIVRDNSKTSLDIKDVESRMKEVSQFADKMESRIEHPNALVMMELSHESKINALLNFIDSKPFHYGVFNSLFYMQTEKGGAFGHAVGFVKKGDSISWFDPNHGEISFPKFSDFKNWFHKEAKEGVQNFLISDGKHKTLKELFPPEYFTKQQVKEHSLAERMQERELASANRKNVTVEIASYRLMSYSSEKFINPHNKDIIADIENSIQNRQGGRGVRNKFDPTMKQASQYLSLLTASQKDQVVFDTVMYVMANNYQNQNLTQKIASSSGFKNLNEMTGDYSAKLIQHFGADKLAEVNDKLIKPMEQALRHGRLPDIDKVAEAAHELSAKETSEFRPSMK